MVLRASEPLQLNELPLIPYAKATQMTESPDRDLLTADHSSGSLFEFNGWFFCVRTAMLEYPGGLIVFNKYFMRMRL
jgi:hypothetical protein